MRERDGDFLERRPALWLLAGLVVAVLVAVLVGRSGFAIVLVALSVLIAWIDLTVGRNDMEERLTSRLETMSKNLRGDSPRRG